MSSDLSKINGLGAKTSLHLDVNGKKKPAINPLTSNRRTVRCYKKFLGCRTDVPYVVTKVFFKYLSSMCIKNFNPRLAGGWDSARLDFGQIMEFFFFLMVMHRIFKKKLRRYFPDPLGIRESFREMLARCKRVNALPKTNGSVYRLVKINFVILKD